MSSDAWLTTSAGIRMPKILYGTAWKKERTADLVEMAIDAGFRGIDTAAQPKHYDERLVGVGLQRAITNGVTREALYLQTKFTPISSQDSEQLPYDKTAPLTTQVMQSFSTSQDNLKTDYVDCLILHSPLATHAQTLEAWQAMEQIHVSGGTRQLGISNCYDLDVMKRLYDDAKVKPAIVQNRFYKDTGYEAPMREWCDSLGIIFESFWSLTANPHIVNSDVVKELAAKYNKSQAQIFFRYLSQMGIVPLSGTTSIQHMKDDLELFSFELTLKDRTNIDQLL